MSLIKVKLNAPNWPKMVSKEPSSTSRDAMKGQCVSSSSLWLEKRANKTNNANTASSEQLTPFAAKTRILRQCTNCQMLYSSFHKCADGAASTWWRMSILRWRKYLFHSREYCWHIFLHSYLRNCWYICFRVNFDWNVIIVYALHKNSNEPY